MYLDFENPKLEEQIEGLRPVNGVCIFVDICNSTEIKNKALKKWILLLGNTLRFCAETFQLFGDNVIKLIGDEIMIFIPDDRINQANENYATILDFLKNCVSKNPPEIENFTLKTKAAVHYCKDTYNISFSRKADDYYGNGIDLTARLMKKPKEREIIMSETFFDLVSQKDPSFLTGSSDKKGKKFKGFNRKIFYRILPVR